MRSMRLLFSGRKRSSNHVDLHEVHDVGPRDHFARGKVETVVLDERHDVLVHSEDDRVVRPSEQQTAYDLSERLR